MAIIVKRLAPTFGDDVAFHAAMLKLLEEAGDVLRSDIGGVRRWKPIGPVDPRGLTDREREDLAADAFCRAYEQETCRDPASAFEWPQTRAALVVALRAAGAVS